MQVLNIGSPTFLEACLMNRPLFNFCFDSYNQNDELDMIYDSKHYSPIFASNSASLILEFHNLKK
jgi:hypothetical protein